MAAENTPEGIRALSVVFLRFPAQEIARCRTVCRRWRDTTGMEPFRRRHSEHSCRKPMPLFYFQDPDLVRINLRAVDHGKVILEAAILTTVVILSLTAYTFWAARRGQDFSFLGPFLFASLIMLLVFGFIQILFPMGKLSHMIYGALAALIFSGYIVYDTDNIIKRYTYDRCLSWAVHTLHLKSRGQISPTLMSPET